MELNVTGLRNLYKKNHTAQLLLDYFAGRSNNATETKVDRILHILNQNGEDVPRSQIIDAFRELEKLQCGTFVTGRKGWPSRFVWNIGLVEVGKVASGEEQQVRTTEVQSNAEEEAETLKHIFFLRPDMQVELSLPSDLTLREAKRLATFVESIPFAEDEE